MVVRNVPSKTGPPPAAARTAHEATESARPHGSSPFTYIITRLAHVRVHALCASGEVCKHPALQCRCVYIHMYTCPLHATSCILLARELSLHQFQMHGGTCRSTCSVKHQWVTFMDRSGTGNIMVCWNSTSHPSLISDATS